MVARPFVVDGFAMAPPQATKSASDDIMAYSAVDNNNPPASERHLITYVDSDPPSRFPNSSAFPDGRFFDVEVVRSAVWVIDALVVFHVISVLVVFGRNSWRFDTIRSNPLFGTSVAVLDQYGLKNTARIINKNEWWRLISSIFVHAGVGDTIYSLLVLLAAGVPLESAYGFRPIIIIYMTSGLIGMAVSCVFTPQFFSIGAVAAVAGLLGARIADVAKNGLESRKGSVRLTLLMCFVLAGLGLVMGLMPLIDNVAFIVALGMGFLAGISLLKLTIKIGPNIQRSNLTLVELLAGVCWLLLVSSAALNFNEIRSGRLCFYCQLPSWFPLCIETRYWTCASQLIK